MRIVIIILGLIASVIAVVMSFLPFGLIALIPCLAALVFGLIAFTMSKNQKTVKLPINVIFLLTLIALVVTTYKSITNENSVETDTEFIEKEKESEEEALDELEEIGDIDE